MSRRTISNGTRFVVVRPRSKLKLATLGMPTEGYFRVEHVAPPPPKKTVYVHPQYDPDRRVAFRAGDVLDGDISRPTTRNQRRPHA